MWRFIRLGDVPDSMIATEGDDAKEQEVLLIKNGEVQFKPWNALWNITSDISVTEDLDMKNLTIVTRLQNSDKVRQIEPFQMDPSGALRMKVRVVECKAESGLNTEGYITYRGNKGTSFCQLYEPEVTVDPSLAYEPQ